MTGKWKVQREMFSISRFGPAFSVWAVYPPTRNRSPWLFSSWAAATAWLDTDNAVGSVGGATTVADPTDNTYLIAAAEEFCLAEQCDGLVCTERPNHSGWHRVELDDQLLDTWPNHLDRGW